MASIGRRGWRRAKTSLTTKFDKRVTLPLADVLERVTRLQDQVAELTDIVRTQVRMANETTELLGRLLATASSRLDAVEDSLARITAAPAPGPGAIPLRPGGPTASRPREEQRAFLGFEEKTASPGSESETASPGSEEKTASYGSESETASPGSEEKTASYGSESETASPGSRDSSPGSRDSSPGPKDSSLGSGDSSQR